MFRKTLLLAALLGLSAAADEVVLKNGNIVRGKARQEDGRVVVELQNGRVTLSARDVKEIRRDDGTVEKPADGAPEPRSDDAVGEAVREALEADPGVPQTELRIEMSDGLLVLAGRLDTLAERERALAVAGTVTGVREIRDEIEIQQRPDRRIAEDLRLALGREVDVENGRVTLVEAEEVDVARGAAGVQAVRVKTGDDAAPPGDLELREDVEERLRWDAQLDHARIEVEAEGGTVRLGGAVPSAAEKAKAVRHAKQAGAQRVESGRLEVTEWRRDPAFRREKFDPVEDAELEKAVRRMLSTSGVRNLDVGAEDGEATLQGEVSTLRGKREAEREARRVAGVRRVYNRIRVRSGPPASDPDLVRRLRAVLDLDPWVQHQTVGVEVENGVARLTGEVPSYFEKARADELAAGIRGVREVQNGLRVDAGAPPLAPNPYVDRWEARDFPWSSPPPPSASRLEGEELREAVERRFLWSPYVNEDEVQVRAAGGEVTLTGTVGAEPDRETAGRLALEAGAAAVVNRLIVR